MPVCTYASEVWAPDLFSDYKKCLSNQMEKLHIGFLRGIFNIRKSTSLWMILREFGRLPIFFYWWSQVLKFMKRAHKLDESSLVRQAFLQEIVLWKGGKKCWLQGVMEFLRGVFDDSPDMPQRVDDRLKWVLELPIMSVKKHLVKRWKNIWEDIAQHKVQASKSLLYHTAMTSVDTKTKHGWFAPASHMRVAMHSDIHTNLVRFRLGNHNLLSEQRRWLKLCSSSVFSNCRLCSLQRVEDEEHVLLCCPYYERIRIDDKFADLLPYQGGLRELMNCPHQIVLAKFISSILECRNSAVL